MIRRSSPCLGGPVPLAVPRCERLRALDHRDYADPKGTVQSGAPASVYRNREPLHGFKLGNGRYSAVGRRIETPYMNMTYHSTHGPLFETGPRPPNTPYIGDSNHRLCADCAGGSDRIVNECISPRQTEVQHLFHR